jgi:hypothetical protein
LVAAGDLLCTVPPPTAHAAPVGYRAAATAATTLHTVDDPRLTGLSGLVATADGYIVESDSDLDKSLIRISWLDARSAYSRRSQ